MDHTAIDNMAAEFRPFWSAAARGELCFPFCTACKRFHWYPLKVCPHCRADAIEWRQINGRGTVYSWTIVRYPFSEETKAWLPYVVALVEFADAPGVRLVTNLIDVDFAALDFDKPVVPAFDIPTDRRASLPFRPAN